VKTEEQQAALMLMGGRQQLMTRRTQLSNAIRGYAAEFGLITAKGLDKLEPLLARIAQDEACQRWRARCLRCTAGSMRGCRST